MISIFEALSSDKVRKFKTERTKNYIIHDFRNPARKFISRFRRKVVIGKDGRKHILTFAILNKKGRRKLGDKTRLTSIWHEKT